MKVAAGLTVLVISAALISQADAATYRKKKHVGVQHYRALPAKTYRQRDNDDDPTGYYEHRLEAVRFGSRRWWSIYDELSGGGQRP